MDAVQESLPLGQPAPARQHRSRKERFEEYLERNPKLVPALVALARRRIERGAVRLSMKGLYEDIREDPAYHAEQAGWKLDNTFTADLARLLMKEQPDLLGKFEVRKRARP